MKKREKEIFIFVCICKNRNTGRVHRKPIKVIIGAGRWEVGGGNELSQFMPFLYSYNYSKRCDYYLMKIK